jgi:hypothetical protein
MNKKYDKLSKLYFKKMNKKYEKFSKLYFFLHVFVTTEYVDYVAEFTRS